MDEQRAWIRSRRRKRLRIVAVALCVCLLVTTRPDILEALSTFASEWKDSTVYVSGFGELPEEVRAQTVPLGTGEDELSLPDTLEAFAAAPEDKEPSGDADGEDADKPGNAEDGKENQPEDGTGESGDGTGDAGSPGEENESGTGDTGNADEGNDGAGESGDGNGDAGNPGEGTESGTGENGNPGEGGDGGTGDTGNADEGTGGAGASDDGTGESGNPEEGADGGNGDAENPGEGTDGGSGDVGNADVGSSGEGEPESQNESAPADDEGGTGNAGETAKGYGDALNVQRGVFVMPVYMSEPETSAEPQTMERKEESVMIKGVTWQSEPAYDGSVEGTYVFTAILPEGYALAEGVSLPQITVTVQGTDPVVQELLTRIAAMPEAEEYLADEPDVETEEEYETWMDGLSTYTAEALDLWEMYETFTEEQRAQVPTEALVKLAAWVELAGQLAESSMVMAAADENGGTLGDGLTWKLEGNTLTISGNGAMPDWAKVEDTPWYGSRGDIKSVIIENGVTNIGSHAFLNCSALTSVTISGGVTSIGDKAFYDCKSLTSVTIPNSVTSIGSSAFQNCEKLTSVAFIEGGSIPTLGWGCFFSCPCVMGTGRGLNIPSCKYLTVDSWSTYKENVTIREPHMLTHTENGAERYWACSVCQTQFSETINAENCDAATAVASENYTVTFTPNSGYNVPTEVTVTIGGTALGSGDYTYKKSSTTGTLTIPIGKITGDVIISATAEVTLITIAVTLKKDGSLWSEPTVTLKKGNDTYTVDSAENGTYRFKVPQGGTYKTYVNGKNAYGEWPTDNVLAYWSATFNYLTVTYDANGAIGTVPPEEIFSCKVAASDSGWVTNYYVKTTLPMKKPGYVQTGWSETPGGSGEKVESINVNDGAGWVRTDPIKLYPVFAPAKVTINAENCTHDGAAEVAETGNYTVTFTPESGYDVPAGVTVEIGGTTLGSGDYTYNGTTGTLTILRDKITGHVTITANASSEHSLTYMADNAQGTITESCDNGCTHSATVEFETFLTEPYTYTGNAIEPFGVKYAPAASAWLGGEEKKPVISYAGNTNAGTATATLSVPGESASVSRTFTIAPKSLEDVSVTATLGSDSYPYTGNAIEPAVTVSDSAIGGGMTLVKDRDYTVTYADNTAVGTNTAKVTVTGTGNYTGECTLTFTIQDKAPDIPVDDLDIDYSGGTVKLPDDIKDQVEIKDADGNQITPNPDGSLPVEPGTTITIKYPGSDKETVITIPGRPAAPAPKKVTVTDTTATVSDPAAGEEYVLVARGAAPDWSNAKTTGAFTELTPNTAYDLYVRKQATNDSFASEPAKTQIRTTVTIKKPETGGAGAGKEGNDVSEGKPSEDGDSVTYTGTCEEGSTPVIIIDGEEIIPEITWDEDGKKGTWSYTVPVEDGESEVGIQVAFKDRTYTGLKIEPARLHIYADDTANQSADKLLDYLKAHCTVKATYDNGTSDDATNGADYEADRAFNAKGAVYEYTVEANADAGKAILTVSPVTAAVKTPDALAQTPKSGGYTKAEVDAWLPKEVTVTYTGADGYAQRTESMPVTWKTDALGADFGATAGSKTISGTATLPEWATGENTVSIEIGFVNRNALTDDQMHLSISGWAYGAQTAPAPEGSVTVTDTEQTYRYRYSADNGRSWVTADGLPKSGSGNIIPGDYQVEMTYSGRNYTGTKTAAFTVVQKPVTAEKGTLAVENRNYDGTTKATLKAGGKPALVGVIEKDDVSLSGTLKAVFTDKGPKKNIPVTVTGFALTGSEAGYYKLVNTTLTLKATINNKDGSSSSGGSSGGSSGNNSGSDNGDSGDNGDNGNSSDNGDSGNSGGDSGNGGNTGTGGSTGSGGTGGNNGGTGGNSSGTGGNNGSGGNNGGATGTGSNNGTGGSGKGGTGNGNTTGKGGSSGTGKGISGNGSSSTTGNGGTGNGATSGTGNGTNGNGRDSTGNGSGTGGSTGSGTGNGDAGAWQEGDGQQTKGVTVQTVQAAADDGRIVISGETEAPVAIGTLTEDAPGATRLLIGGGTVTVTVVCEDDQYTVGMNDATAVANAVLTPEQIQRVDEGESLEIRVDIRDISQSIPPQDRETVENGYEAYGKYLSELKRGGYVDISVYMKTGDGGWNAVSETTEPLEIVIGIPEELWGEGREYYIIRAHEGRYTLLNDMDAVPETITIVTDLFSSYAIAYREAGGADTGNDGIAYGLSHISPKFLGIVSLIWLTAAVAGIVIAIIVLRRKKDREKATTV